MSSLGRNEVTYKSSVLLLAKIKHGCGLVSPAISVPKDKYDMQQIQRCMILFFQFLNNFLCGFASSFYQNIHCGTLLWEKHQLPADHQAGWPLCKLWEHRFPVPDLACTPPPAPGPWIWPTHFVCACIDMVYWSVTEAFYLNCLRSLRAFAGCFFGAEWRILETTFHKRVLWGIEVFFRWKWVYCSLAVTLERTVFPFVKQYIEDKMAAECCLIRHFAHIFWAARKGQYDNFPLNNRAIDI